MSASPRESGPIQPPPITSFYAECVECEQIGLFATVDGFLACDWRLKANSEVPRTMRNGLFSVQSTCGTCRKARKTANSALRKAK